MQGVLVLICFEGLEAAGKTTQTKLLYDSLSQMGYKVSRHAYPDRSSMYGKIIQDFLNKKVELNAEEQFMLYALDMVKDKYAIRKELDSGMIVLMDRYFFSTIAYQCTGGVDFERAKKFEQFLDFPNPDVVLYLDLPVDVAMKRKALQKGLDRFEENDSFLGKVKEIYEKLFDEGYGAKKWERIDATKPLEEVQKNITTVAVDIIKQSDK